MPHTDPAQRRAYDRAWNPEGRRRIRKKHSRTPAAHAAARLVDYKAKIETLRAYSPNGEIQCRWCGFDDIRALHLDHIENNGAADRAARTGKPRRAGVNFYRILRRAGFPPGYQVLCANCNLVKHHEWQRGEIEKRWSDKPVR